jgi:hypothetical protein
VPKAARVLATLKRDGWVEMMLTGSADDEDAAIKI